MADIFAKIYDEATLTITVGLILLLMFLAQYLLRRAFRRFEKSRVHTELEDTTNYRFLYYALLALIYITGIGFAIWNIPSLRHVVAVVRVGGRDRSPVAEPVELLRTVFFRNHDTKERSCVGV